MYGKKWKVKGRNGFCKLVVQEGLYAKVGVLQSFVLLFIVARNELNYLNIYAC